jgi:hypothetical protein
LNWFQKIFSLDEMKFSSLILCLFLCLGYGMYLVMKHGDLPPNLASIINSLIYTVGGVNAINGASSYFGNRYGGYGYGNSLMGNYGTSMYPTGATTTTTQQPVSQTVTQTAVTTNTGIRPQDRGI